MRESINEYHIREAKLDPNKYWVDKDGRRKYSKSESTLFWICVSIFPLTVIWWMHEASQIHYLVGIILWLIAGLFMAELDNNGVPYNR